MDGQSTTALGNIPTLITLAAKKKKKNPIHCF